MSDRIDFYAAKMAEWSSPDDRRIAALAWIDAATNSRRRSDAEAIQDVRAVLDALEQAQEASRPVSSREG